MRPCFKFKAAANDDSTTVLAILDEIGFWGVQASDFRAALSGVTTPNIQLEISSPGGDVFAGLAIYNMLKASGKTITTKVLGVAASAASLIAMAGDKITMPKNAFMMVHNPWGVSIGNADEMRETADVLDKIGNSLLGIYVSRTGQSEDDVAAMLAKDTWMTADEALASGFTDEVTEEVHVSAAFDMKRADLPENVRSIYNAAKPVEKTADEIKAEADAAAERDRIAAEDAAKLATPVAKAVHEHAVKAGLTGDMADFIAIAASTNEDGMRKVKNAAEVVAIASFAKRPAAEVLALVKSDKPVAEVRASIMQAMADEDVQTSTTRPVQNSRPSTAKPASDVYAARAAAKQARKA